MEMFLVFVVLHKVKDDVPQLAGTVPLRTGTGIDAFLFWICVLPSRCFFDFFWLSRASYNSILMYSKFQANELI